MSKRKAHTQRRRQNRTHIPTPIIAVQAASPETQSVSPTDSVFQKFAEITETQIVVNLNMRLTYSVEMWQKEMHPELSLKTIKNYLHDGSYPRIKVGRVYHINYQKMLADGRAAVKNQNIILDKILNKAS
jgi:hypothetical protein